MSFKDVLLTLTTYPEPTPPVAVERAVGLAVALSARLSAIACEAKIPASGGVLGNALLDVPTLIANELKKSADNARNLLATFERSAQLEGIFQDKILEHCLTSEVAGRFAEHARLRDLTMIPVPEGDWVDPWYAETLIFGSGRPTMILPQSEPSTKPVLDTVLVAWDFSRPAARAVADALPVLERAKQVFVVTIKNEKPIVTRRSGVELAKNLAHHGVRVVLDELDAGNRTIGAILTECIAARKADLLVMGAYGHSRIREFILGGATKSMLSHPPIPILLSH